MIGMKVNAFDAISKINKLIYQDPAKFVAARLARDSMKYLNGIAPKGLKGGFYSQVTKEGDTWTIHVRHESKRVTPDVLRIYEYGSPAHYIRPKRKQALMFEIDGKKVFAAYVVHRAQPPLKLIHRTTEYAESRFKRIIEMTFGETL